jgi:hypothetical protein
MGPNKNQNTGRELTEDIGRLYDLPDDDDDDDTPKEPEDEEE